MKEFFALVKSTSSYRVYCLLRLTRCDPENPCLAFLKESTGPWVFDQHIRVNPNVVCCEEQNYSIAIFIHASRFTPPNTPAAPKNTSPLQQAFET